jgi:inner membrane protein
MAGATISTGQPWYLIVMGVFLAAAAGLAPDIDHAGSRAAHSLGLVSRLTARGIQATLGHRGGTHSLLVALLITLICGWALTALGGDVLVVTIGTSAIALGYGLHLALDWLTPSGVPLYWPCSSRRYRSTARIRTGSARETAFLWMSIVALTAAFLSWGWTHGTLGTPQPPPTS